MLYRNNGDGTFSDVTSKAGVGNAGRWGTSASFGDYDNDGHLDLYVANYVDLDLDHLPEFGQGSFCQYRGFPVSCGPRGLKGGRDRLYHNNGDGTFTDVAEKSNIDPGSYFGLGVMWLDYDRDGCLDVYVADDSTPSMLYRGDCKGGFTEVGARAGVAYSGDGREQAGMGIDSADYDNDGWPDIAKANFSDDTNNLFHNDHNGGFTDLAGPANFGPISTPFLGFGLKFFDADNDGWPDVFIANGHVNPQVDQHNFGVTYAERPFLFHNLGNGKFEEIGQHSGVPFTRRYVGRGAATADFFNDGKSGPPGQRNRWFSASPQESERSFGPLAPDQDHRGAVESRRIGRPHRGSIRKPDSIGRGPGQLQFRVRKRCAIALWAGDCNGGRCHHDSMAVRRRSIGLAAKAPTRKLWLRRARASCLRPQPLAGQKDRDSVPFGELEVSEIFDLIHQHGQGTVRQGRRQGWAGIIPPNRFCSSPVPNQYYSAAQPEMGLRSDSGSADWSSYWHDPSPPVNIS